MHKVTTVSVPADANKGFGRDGQWTVRLTCAPEIAATGRTLTDARSDASDLIAAMLAAVDTPPAFAVDDDGTLIVAIAHASGSMIYRVTDNAATLIGSTVYPPREAVSRTHHYTQIPTR